MFWQRIRQLQEEDHPVSVRVESANKGGLLVKYGPYQGFIPVSQFGPVSVLEAGHRQSKGNALREWTRAI